MARKSPYVYNNTARQLDYRELGRNQNNKKELVTPPVRRKNTNGNKQTSAKQISSKQVKTPTKKQTRKNIQYKNQIEIDEILAKQKEIQAKQKIKKVAHQINTIIYITVVFGLLFAIGYRNTKIDESFVALQKTKSDLGLLQKQNEQLEIKIENSLNLDNVQQIASERLGMQKLDNNQKIYLTLPKRDYIEPAAEKVVVKEESFVDKLIKMIINLL